MATRHCTYKDCKSDSRYNSENLFYFIPFPKPCTQVQKDTINEKISKHLKHCEMCGKADLCLRLCNAKCGIDLKKIRKWTYICSLHFDHQSGPTEECPNPKMYIKKTPKRRTDRSNKRINEENLKKRKIDNSDELTANLKTVDVQLDKYASESSLCQQKNLLIM